MLDVGRWMLDVSATRTPYPQTESGCSDGKGNGPFLLHLGLTTGLTRTATWGLPSTRS